ncbi:hypothetical protein [Lactobacillus johnsonii]|nr:hypothetical protein [Lactobacillus johnsonii]
MIYNAEAIIDYDYAAHKNGYRMPLNVMFFDFFIVCVLCRF